LQSILGDVRLLQCVQDANHPLIIDVCRARTTTVVSGSLDFMVTTPVEGWHSIAWSVEHNTTSVSTLIRFDNVGGGDGGFSSSSGKAVHFQIIRQLGCRDD